MGGNSMGLTGLETPDASRPGGPTSAANLLAEGDRPGPIGMNNPSIPAEELNSGGAVDAQKILSYASSNEGQRVGSGECFDLADKALKNAGAKSAEDYGKVTKEGTYIWGSAVDLASVKPGDIIQFTNYKYVRTDYYDNESGSGDPSVEQQRSPKHTAIVKSVGSDGKITVWEQNISKDGSGTGGPVQSFELYFKSFQTGDTKNGVKVTVSGTVKFYRPQPRK